MRWILAAGAVAATAGLALAEPSGPTTRPGTLRIFVSIAPQAYFVERVGGAAVSVSVLVGSGQSPHVFEPTARQIADLGDADAYFTIGVDFERAFVPQTRRMFPRLRIVDTQTGVPLRDYQADEAGLPADHAEHHADHHSGEPHDHVAGSPDPHIWLSPRLAKIQAQTICDTLVQLDPARANEYRTNLAAFHADLDRVREELAAALAPLKGREVFVFHPAFGYFLDEFGLRQVPVELGGKEPNARQLADLIDRAKAAGVRVIFVQPQFPTKSAEVVAQAIDGVVLPLDDLARDYLTNLRDMADTIRRKFLPANPPPN